MDRVEKEKQLLRDKFKFPCRIVMHLKKRHEGHTIILHEFKDKKKKLTNVKFDEMQVFSLDGLPSIAVYIGDFHGVNDLHMEWERQCEIWLDKEDMRNGRKQSSL